ncbi:MAG: DMT family transporter [Sphingomonadaceae bacterium]
MSNNASYALLRPRIALPFVLVALIWGSTWLVIKDQLDAAPPGWSVTWRFGLAAMGMAGLTWWRGGSLRIGAQGQKLAALIGLAQFCLNFNFVYRAELYITSGLVAVLFGLLMVPNALLGRIVLGTPITRRFVAGTCVALVGIAMMLVHEARMAPLASSVWPGIMLALCGLLCAAFANIVQATPAARKQDMFALLTWAMLWGMAGDVALAWFLSGPPVFPADPRYWAGVAYLAFIGSVITFPLYFMLIREIGPGRAAYNGVLVPVIAMILSTLFENYQWSLLAVSGGALGLAGMAIALRARNPVSKSG